MRGSPQNVAPAGGRSSQQTGSDLPAGVAAAPPDAEPLTGAGTPAVAANSGAARSCRSSAELPAADGEGAELAAALDAHPGDGAAAGCRPLGGNALESSAGADPAVDPAGQPQAGPSAQTPAVIMADRAQSPRSASAVESGSPRPQSLRVGGSAAPRKPASGSPGGSKPATAPLNPPASLAAGTAGMVFTNPFFDSDPMGAAGIAAAAGRDDGSGGEVENAHGPGTPSGGSPARLTRGGADAAGGGSKAGSPGEYASSYYQLQACRQNPFSSPCVLSGSAERNAEMHTGPGLCTRHRWT